MTYDAWSLISQPMASAISAGSRARPSGISGTDPVQPARVTGVGVDRGADEPGATLTTRIPSSATSSARPIVSASTPAFAAAYWTYHPALPASRPPS